MFTFSNNDDFRKRWHWATVNTMEDKGYRNEKVEKKLKTLENKGGKVDKVEQNG